MMPRDDNLEMNPSCSKHIQVSMCPSANGLKCASCVIPSMLVKPQRLEVSWVIHASVH